MEFIFIGLAFGCGLLVKLIHLPPLIGFLAAGFILNGLGYQSTDNLQALADLGITLMLFTIGLKLNIRDLSKREVWLTSATHMLIWVAICSLIFFAFAYFSLGLFTGLTLQSVALIGFALSFSSTVCVVKILEENGEIRTRHGKVAIGILVMQDIFAVLFLVVVTGKLPSVYALLLPLVFFVRPLLSWLLEKSGHGELLPLTGFLLALGGYELFELVNIKGDLGALLVGMFVAQHAKASELSKALLSFKDLFLIGFFLSIGFTALPDWQMLGTALVISVLLPLKFALFFKLFALTQLRARTSYLSGLVLGNFSEFGLIVMALLVTQGMIAKEWLVVLALAVSFSFLVTSVLYKSSHNQYSRLKSKLKAYESPNRLPEDTYTQPTNADVLVIGLGRVGKGAYGALNNMLGEKVWGVDADPIRIEKLQEKGMQVMIGDGEDIDFWENTHLDKVQLVMLALPSIEDISNITEQLRLANYQGKIAAIARYEDQIAPLLEAGTDKVFNFFTEAGTGFAEESLQMIDKQ